MFRADASAARRRLDRLAHPAAAHHPVADRPPAVPPPAARPLAVHVAAGRPVADGPPEDSVSRPAPSGDDPAARPLPEPAPLRVRPSCAPSARPDDAGRPSTSGGAPADPTAGAGGWVPTAVRAAALEYGDSYGVAYGLATDLSAADEPTQRVRWSVPWRLAASAATAVALVVGATLIRASALAPGDPVELPTPAATTAGSSAAGFATPASASATDAGQLVLHVVGAVARPGVVRLPPGARVQDAIEAAGGAAGDANLAAVNLARPVTDGEQLVVPGPGQVAQPSPPSSPGSAGSRLDLNAATLADLDSLPGIGPVLAQRILDRRLQHRFTSVDELSEVSGIGPTLLDRLRPMVRV